MNTLLLILCELKEKELERDGEQYFVCFYFFSLPVSPLLFPHTSVPWVSVVFFFYFTLYSGLGLRFGKQWTQLILSGGLLLLNQVRVAFSDAPAVRGRHGRAVWTTRGGLQLLPVITTGSGKINQVMLN